MAAKRRASALSNACVANGRAKQRPPLTKRTAGKRGQPTRTKTVAKPEKYEPTPVEQAILEKYREHRKQNPSPLLKVTHVSGNLKIEINHPDYKLGTVLAMNAVGTASLSLFNVHDLRSQLEAR
jgi:hypothetical protein